MAKEVKISIKDIDKLEFELDEDAYKGDWFTLNTFSKIDLNKVRIALEPQKAAIINSWKKEVEDAAINKYKQTAEYLQLTDKINDLNNQINNLQKELKVSSDLAVSKFKDSSDYQNLLTTITTLKNNIDNLQKVSQERVDNAVAKFKTTKEYTDLLDEINNLKNSNSTLSLNYKNLQDNEQKDIELKTREIKDNLKNEPFVVDLNKQIEDLKTQNADLSNQLQLYVPFHQNSSKLVGEELEQWIMQLYNEQLAFPYGNSADFEKANEVINGRKPDFVFSVYHDNKNLNPNDPNYHQVIGKVIIEAKNEASDSKEANRNKNKIFYDRLQENTLNYGGQYSILVTTLEKDNVFSILVAPEPYKNMFIVRPLWLMPLLSLLYKIINKEAEISNYGKTTFESQELITKFRNFRNSLWTNSISKIKKDLEDIGKRAKTITTAAASITKLQDRIITKYFNQLKNEVDSFSINTNISNQLENDDDSDEYDEESEYEEDSEDIQENDEDNN